MNKIKLFIVTNIMDIGGAERTVQTIALYLDKEKFDVTILCVEGGGSRVELLRERGVRVLVGNGTIDKIKELVPNPDVDVLHFHRRGQYENDLHRATVDYLKPKKLMETNIFAFVDPNIHFDLQLYKSMMMLSERAWKDFTPTRETCLKQRVAYNPVTVDYFDKFRISKEERELLRRELGIKQGDIVLGRVGRDDAVKWGDLVLTAIPKILKSNPKIKILFRTVPSARIHWFEKRKFFDGRVIILPESSLEKEIAETYQLLDVYLHMSRRGEAFGNSLNEAMVWALPIIVENTPHWDNGQMEQVTNGKTGWVVKSVGGLVSAVKDLVSNPEMMEMFGKAGRKKVVENFSTDIGIKQYELGYLQLADEVNELEVLKKMFPTADDIILYNKKYSDFKKLDFPHKKLFWLEIKNGIYYWRWRVLDSLVARGYIKL